MIAGKYAVERVLGDGGMGVVVAARHLELGSRVALKFLLPEAAQNPEACQRFVREARAAARIRGEHVARVLDVGTREDGMPFIVMEYLEGCDLERIVEARGPLAVADAVHYVLQACEAVAQAHALGIVHRDLKPANLFLTTNPDGSPLVKVLDFGISKAPSVFARTRPPSITTVNASMGTPAYMSPEQARDAGKVDARSDVWSLGAILYELVAGKPAFDAESVPALVMMIATEEPPALESVQPDVPAALAAVVARCLRKHRDDRYADVAELARALEPFAPDDARHHVARIARILDHGASAPPPPVARSVPPASDAPASRTHSAWGRTGGDVRRRRARSVALGLAAIAAVLVSAAFVWSRHSGTSFAALEAALGRRARAVPAPSPAPAAPPALAPNDVTPRDAADEPNVDEPSSSRAVPPASAASPTGSRRAESPTRESGGSHPFAATKAATELFAAAERARSCTRPGAPSGPGRAAVTFAPNGRVSRVALSAPFAGSSNERCLRDAFGSAKIPAYSGAARTLEQRFRVIHPNAPGTLTFESNVPAEVTLDGRPLGTTPKTVTAAPGSHVVVFTHAELGQKEHSVTLSPGQDKSLRATFSPFDPHAP